MRIAVVSNIDNGKGLQKDFEFFAKLAREQGHEVKGLHFQREAHTRETFDLVVFLETLVPSLMGIAPRVWLVPNAEWWAPCWDSYLPGVHRLLAKTRRGLELFPEVGARGSRSGWIGDQDLKDSAIERRLEWLHIAGGSSAKGTEAVLAAWRLMGEEAPPLTVVGSVYMSDAPNVTKSSRLSLPELRALQNRCRFHLQPSRAEGWGHILYESAQVGAILFVPDKGSASEVRGAVLLESKAAEIQGRETAVDVSPSVIVDVVRDWSSKPDLELEAKSQEISRYWRQDRERTEALLSAALEEEEVLAREKGGRWNPARHFETGRSDLRLSICLPAHASWAPLVARTLLSLRGQTAHFSSFEVVIGADGGDPSGALAEVAKGHPYQVRVVSSPRPRGENRPHRNHARNVACRAAKARVIWPLDCDFLFPPNAVRDVIREHDSLVAQGVCPVLTPCLGGVKSSEEEWVEVSRGALERGQFGRLAAIVNGSELDSHIFSGFVDQYQQGEHSSVSIGAVPEGQPILWRALFDALGGFDEELGEWGADKEEFVTRLKGLQEEGAIDIRLLTSVLMMHQPHGQDETRDEPEVQIRQAKHYSKIRIIKNRGGWWRKLLASSIEAITEERPRIQACSSGVFAKSSEGVGHWPEEMLCRYFRARRVAGEVGVVGEGADRVAQVLSQEASVSALPLTWEALVEKRDLGGVVSLGAIASDGERAKIISRALKVKGNVALLEQTKLTGGSIKPIEIQREFPGASVQRTCDGPGGKYTVFWGRLTQRRI